MQWATGGQLNDVPLLEACLRDLRYDTQVVDSRGDWLWGLIRAAGAVDRLRVPILHSLYQLSDERSASQLCELACGYAEAGDDTFRTRLYEIVEQRPFGNDDCLGEEEIIKVDGEKAFLFAARIRGNQLTGREWDWHDGILVQIAGEQLGEERVAAALENATDGAIRLFCEGWRAEPQKEVRPDPSARRAEMRSKTAGDIAAAAQFSKSPFGLFRSWGVHADEADLQQVLRDLRASEEPVVIANLLKVFTSRKLPQFDVRVLELCEHPDADVRQRAFNALAGVQHARIRAFALAEIRKSPLNRFAVGLFVSNYQPGDEQRLLDAIDLPADEWDLHGLLMDVIKIFENNPNADPTQLGTIAYAATPCEMCRRNAVRVLLRSQAAPAWMTEECRFDSCQRLVEELTRPMENETV